MKMKGLLSAQVPAMKGLLSTLALAAQLFAGQVYMSEHGKTYHTDRHCMALARATHVYTADESAAESHGLHLCGICAHRKGAKAGTRSWAAPEPNTADPAGIRKGGK